MIGSVARQVGHAVLLLDAMLSLQPEEAMARRAAAFCPDIVGFTAMSSGDIQSIVALIARLNALCAVAPRFVVGGSLVTTVPRETMAQLPREVVGVRFEGEAILLSLVECWKRGQPIHHLHGLAYRDANGIAVTTPAALPVNSLDDLPFPARDLAPALRRLGLGLNVQGSRGCVGSCAYCSAPFFRRPASPAWRGRSPKHIADEISEIVGTHGVRVFNFVDDDFLGPDDLAARRATELSDCIEERALHIAFSIQARPSSLTSDVVSNLARAGLVYVFLGLESADADVLRGWGRPQDIDSAWAKVELLRQLGVNLQAGAILFHPDATLTSVGQTAQRLHKHGLLNYRTATNRLRLLPGSRLYSQVVQEDRTTEPGAALDAPIADERVARLHQRLEQALSPVRAPWVFVASRLPNLLGQARVQAKQSATVSRPLTIVCNVLASLDHATVQTFFSLHTATVEHRDDSTVLALQNANVRAASSAIASLLEADLVDRNVAATLAPLDSRS